MTRRRAAPIGGQSREKSSAEWLTTTDAAELLGVSLNRVRWMRRHAYFPLNSGALMSRRSVEDYLLKREGLEL